MINWGKKNTMINWGKEKHDDQLGEEKLKQGKLDVHGWSNS